MVDGEARLVGVEHRLDAADEIPLILLTKMANHLLKCTIYPLPDARKQADRAIH